MVALRDQAKSLVDAGALPEALQRVDEAIAGGERAGANLLLRASILVAWRRYREALDAFCRASTAGEADPKLFSDWAWTCYLLGDTTLAVDLHARAAGLATEDIDIRFGYAVALLAASRFEEALAEFRFVEAHAPDYGDCSLNIAQCLHRMGDHATVESVISQVLADAPDDPRGWALYGTTLTSLGRENESLAAFTRARALEVSTGTDGGALRPYVASLLHFGRAMEARSTCEEGLRTAPELAVHGTYAFSLLTSGRLAEGWAQYECRWMQEPMRSLRPKFEMPPWVGQPLDGKTILLRAEQGFGDIAQFARYAQVLRGRGAKVILQVHDGFGPIANGFVDVDRVITKGEPFTEFHYWSHLLSLPRFLGSEAGFEARFPYLNADPDRVSRWSTGLGHPARLRVGVVWAGNPKHLRDRDRSIPLEHLVDLLDDPSIQFVSLQKVLRPGDDEVMERLPDFLDVRSGLEDFADTAALIANLDLVICVDTALAHIAGAMHKPVWVMLPYSADFRWLEDRSDTPWYPSMRLFRQPVAGAWSAVIAEVKQQLGRFDPKAASAPSRPRGPDDSIEHRIHPPLPQVAETDIGIMQVTPERGDMSRSLLHYGSYCPDRRDLMARLLPRDAWIVEVAPGVGVETLWLCKVLDQDGHLLCYEDDTYVAQVLRNNLEANDAQRRVSMPRGRLIGRHDLGCGGEHPAAGTCSIDELRLGRLDLILIHDPAQVSELVSGADATLWSLRPALLLDSSPAHADVQATATLREHGYLCWRLRFPLFSEHNFYRRTEDIFAGRSISAILALPEESPRVADVPSRLVEESL